MKKLLAILAVCALLLCVTAGCSSGAKSEMDFAADNSMDDMRAEIAPASGEVTVSGEAGEFKTTIADTRKLIKTVMLSVETKEYDTYLGGIRAAITAAGGYIEQSYANTNGFYDDGNRNSSITARIPADKLDAFLASAGENGKIVSRNDQVDDVTLDYVDIDSRLNALKTERENLTKLLTDADSLENIIAIQARLSEVNYQIESYESQMRTLENQISYSTVTLEIREVERVSAADEPLSTQIKTKLLNNLSNIRRDSKDFAVVFIGGLPYILIWGAAAVVVLLIVRAAVKKRKRKKAKANAIAPKQ